MNISTCWRHYKTEHLPGVITESSISGVWKLWLLPHFGKTKVTKLTPAQVRAYIVERSVSGADHNTVAKELNMLRSCLNWCRRAGYIQTAPYIQVPQATRPRPRAIDQATINKLLQTGDPFITAFTHIALNTAARPMAILELTWDRVDFEHRVIDFRNPAHPKAHRQKNRAVVPINDRLLGVLLDLKAKAKTDLVLEEDGKPLGRSFYYRWRLMVWPKTGREVSPHCLRHTAATNALTRGCSIEEVQHLLGHKSAKTTESTYVHVKPSYLQKAVDNVQY